MRQATTSFKSSDSLHSVKLLRDCLKRLDSLPGSVAEIGVFTGDSAKVILSMTNCTVHLFDTFEGMPKGVPVEGLDDHKVGDFKASQESVEKELKQYLDRIAWHPGVFPATAVPIPGGLKFAHIDCDLYQTTLAAAFWAWEQLIPGGEILDDDYGASSCRGAKKAIDEFLAATPQATSEKAGTRMIIRKAKL